MNKKILYSITCILSFALCSCLLFFPVLKYNKTSLNKNCKKLIESNLTSDNTYDEAMKESMDEISVMLGLYGLEKDLYQDGTIDNELLDMSLKKLRDNGIYYTDLAAAIKNQIDRNKLTKEIIKQDTTLSKQQKAIAIKDQTINPIIFTGFVVFIAMLFASSFLVFIRSIKGMLGFKKTRIVRIAIFGASLSGFLIFLPLILKRPVSSIDNTRAYINIFMHSVSGSNLCYYYFYGFVICIVLAIIAKFAKIEQKF